MRKHAIPYHLPLYHHASFSVYVFLFSPLVGSGAAGRGFHYSCKILVLDICSREGSSRLQNGQHQKSFFSFLNVREVYIDLRKQRPSPASSIDKRSVHPRVFPFLFLFSYAKFHFRRRWANYSSSIRSYISLELQRALPRGRFTRNGWDGWMGGQLFVCFSLS